jgi:hypothetical protein
MRTDRHVIVCLLLLSAAGCLHAQQLPPPSESSVDTDVTVMGRDDGIIPVPEPGAAGQEVALPSLEPDETATLVVPPVKPPVGDTLSPSPPPADLTRTDPQ